MKTNAYTIGFAMLTCLGSTSACQSRPSLPATSTSEPRATSDPLGVELETIGLADGNLPCGPAEQVASVVDELGRYAAFCRGESDTVWILQTTPVGVDLVPLGFRSPLEDYLTITPESADVPAALLENRSAADVAGRTIVDRSVAHVAPQSTSRASPRRPGDLVVPPVLTAPNECTDPAIFRTRYCGYLGTHATLTGPLDWDLECHDSFTYLGYYARSASESMGRPRPLLAPISLHLIVANCGWSEAMLRGIGALSLPGESYQSASLYLPDVLPKHTAILHLNNSSQFWVESAGEIRHPHDLTYVIHDSPRLRFATLFMLQP
jgi:hypothetical protein